MLRFDDFARRALIRIKGGGGDSTAAAIRTASLYYLADRALDRPAWRVPRFQRSDEEARSVRVRLDEATWQAMSNEAARQGVSMDALAVHAVLYYLADLNSGRVAGRLEAILGEPD